MWPNPLVRWHPKTKKRRKIKMMISAGLFEHFMTPSIISVEEKQGHWKLNDLLNTSESSVDDFSYMDIGKLPTSPNGWDHRNEIPRIRRMHGRKNIA